MGVTAIWNLTIANSRLVEVEPEPVLEAKQEGVFKWVGQSLRVGAEVRGQGGIQYDGEGLIWAVVATPPALPTVPSLAGLQQEVV